MKILFFMKEILIEMIWDLDESVLIDRKEWRTQRAENLESKCTQVGYADSISAWVMDNKRRIYKVY